MTQGLLLTDYVGIDRTTGATINGVDHLRQGVSDVLATFIASRVMLRDYGTKIVRRLGAPLNGDTVADVVATTAEALHRWEPRIILKRVIVSAVSPQGGLTADLIVVVDGREVRLERVF